jgi:predicted alpha/beta-fold hydrolase
LRRERVTTPDGDFVDLDWLDGGAGTPLLLVLHGLEGSAHSHYVRGLLRGAADRGWRGVALNFRSCSGELNRVPRFYHSGETGDLAAVVNLIVAREPEVRLGAVGTSLGGNVLLKWLGEEGDRIPRQLRAAVAVSVPFDLTVCARRLDRGLHRLIYTSNFMRTMRRKVRDKARRYPGFVDVGAVRRARTFAEYDRAVTAPLHGFADERDYWRRASCRAFLSGIRRPALLISALDDPIVPAAALPDPAQLPPHVRAEFVGAGGHAAFLQGRWPWAVRSWAEERALDFLHSAVAEAAGIR